MKYQITDESASLTLFDDSSIRQIIAQDMQRKESALLDAIQRTRFAGVIGLPRRTLFCLLCASLHCPPPTSALSDQPEDGNPFDRHMSTASRERNAFLIQTAHCPLPTAHFLSA
jgi:hypothetical protein